MSTDGYTGTAPYVSLLMSDGQIIKANAEKKEAKEKALAAQEKEAA